MMFWAFFSPRLQRTALMWRVRVEVCCVWNILIVTFGVISAQASTFCSEYASPRAAAIEFGAGWNRPTRTLVAFYRELLQRGKLGDEDLLKMRDGLVQGKRVSPFPRSGNSNAENTQFAKVVNNLSTPELNTAHVILWIDGELRARDKEQNRREEHQKTTQYPFREIEFARVDPGSFLKGEPGSQEKMTLHHLYSAMKTQVTQWMWVREFGENPSHHKVGDQTVEIVINGKRIQLQPDNPVENVTWWSMAEYANRVSERMGLPPTYDLSKIKFDPNTSAAKGTYMPLEDGQIITNEMLVNHPSHNIYETKGIRLPTDAEWEYLVRNRGRLNTAWHSGDDEADLKKVAWYVENAESKTHPVGLLAPLIVDGNSFYDLHGNVWEWTWDRNEEKIAGKENFVGPSEGSLRVVRGGGAITDAYLCRSAAWYPNEPEHFFPCVGGRLVVSGTVKLK